MYAGDPEINRKAFGSAKESKSIYELNFTRNIRERMHESYLPRKIEKVCRDDAIAIPHLFINSNGYFYTCVGAKINRTMRCRVDRDDAQKNFLLL